MPHFTFHSSNLVRKRLPLSFNRGEGITNYDLDNLYPQRMKELSFRSPITKQAIDIQKAFFNGEGFSQNGDVILNDSGMTADDLLNMITGDASLFSGFAKHFNFNGRGLITEANFVPFEFVRFGIPNNLGKHVDVKVSNNWEEADGVNVQGPGSALIQTFPIFRQRDAQVQVLTGRGGQIMYWTGVPDMYPLASLDAVADSTQADAEIQQFELNNAANGFHGTVILKTPGEFEDDEAENKFNRKVNSVLGSNSPGILTVQMDYDEMDADLFEGIPADNKDKLFELAFKHIDRRIQQNYSQPPGLRGVSAEGAVFNQQEIGDSFEFYNSKTKNDRAILLRMFNAWGQFWHEGALDFGEIKPQEFKKPVFEQRVLAPGPAPAEETPEPETELNLIYGQNAR